MKATALDPNQHGFTLLELLLCLSISVIIIIAVTNASITGRRSYQNTTTTLNEIRAARKALDTICEDLKYSRAVRIPEKEKNEITSYTYMQEKESRSIYLKDSILYRKIGNNPPTALIDIPVTGFSCSFDPSDSSNRTIALSIRFANGINLDTTANTMNATTTTDNAYIQ